MTRPNLVIVEDVCKPRARQVNPVKQSVQVLKSANVLGVSRYLRLPCTPFERGRYRLPYATSRTFNHQLGVRSVQGETKCLRLFRAQLPAAGTLTSIGCYLMARAAEPNGDCPKTIKR